MKNLIPVLFILFLVSCKKDEFNPNQVKSFSIQSISNGANYPIKVALPDNYDPASRTYATVYVLDGEENFDFVALEAESISSDYATSNVLVVSVGYGYDRSHDYTPTETGDGSGGAEKFMQFVKDELIPKMEKDFAADPSEKGRVLLGHSFGGLLASYAFTNFNDVFGNYLMLSPSLWYDNEVMMKLEQENRNVNSEKSQLVFMALGGLESNGRMLAPFEAFYRRLDTHYPLMKLARHIEPNLEHMGSKNPNIREGLKFYFQNR